MINNNNCTKEGLWAIKRALRYNVDFIDDLKKRIAKNDKYKSSYERILIIVQNIVDGTNSEGYQELIEWCESRNIDYQKFGIKAP
jgi:hypothetical protein